MASVYLTEPPTRGKVLLHTTMGDVDIELWPKEAPLACRNFIQLALDGAYNDLPWHRVIKGLFVQTGCTAPVSPSIVEGASAYGGFFPDEFHSRLKFTHRGQVACANLNVKDTNGSQFFITLDKAPWLDKKHTIFGKVTGNTIFNVLRMGEVDVDAEDRPHDPPRLLGVEVLDNPFPELAPRRIAAPQSTASAAPTPGLRATGRSGPALRSFEAASDEDDGSGEHGRIAGTGIVSAHDLLGKPPTAASTATRGTHAQLRTLASSEDGDGDNDDEDVGTGRPETAPVARALLRGRPSSAAAAELAAASKAGPRASPPPESAAALSAATAQLVEFERLRAQVLAAKRASAGSHSMPPSTAPSSALATSATAPAATALLADDSAMTAAQRMRAKFAAKKHSAPPSTAATMARLAAFQAKLAGALAATPADAGAVTTTTYHGQVLDDADRDDLDDGSWMTSRLRGGRHLDDALRARGGGVGARQDDGLMTIDPEERDRSRGGVGGRGRVGGGGDSRRNRSRSRERRH